MHPASQSESILTKRLTSTVLRKNLGFFLILLSLLLFILSPLLVISALKQQQEVSAFITTQYRRMIEECNNTTELISHDSFLDAKLAEHRAGNSPEAESRIEQSLQSFVASFSNIPYCMLETQNDTIIQPFSNADTTAKEICLETAGYRHLHEVERSIYFSPIYHDASLSRPDSPSPMYWMFVSKKYTGGGQAVILTAFYNVSDYVENVNNLAADAFNSYVVYDSNRQVAYSTFSDPALQTTALSLSAGDQNPQLFSGGVIQTSRIISIGWHISAYASWFRIFQNYLLILIVILLFYFMPLLLFYTNIVPTIRRFLHPIKTLTDQVFTYSAGEPLTADIHTGDEIEQLGSAITDMTHKICAQIDEIRNKERESSRAHYSVLATEIDPHFIYNTLSIINSMARKLGQDDIVEINMALSKILRERFNDKATIFETVHSAIDTLHQYHTIMKYRYQNPVQISIDAESSLLDDRLPKNMLIPIVENSYYHGLCSADGEISGEIQISIYPDGDTIIIEISDDGAGIAKDRLNYLLAHHFQSPDSDRTHIGLSNVYERLQYIYRSDFSITLDSTAGFGTTVSITIPKYQPDME